MSQNLVALWRSIDNREPCKHEYEDAIDSIIDDMCDQLTVKHITDLIKSKLTEAFISVEAVFALDKAIEIIMEETAHKMLQEKIDDYYLEKYEENQRLKIGSYI